MQWVFPMIKTWNLYIRPSFWEYRRRIKEIAKDSWDEVGDKLYVENADKMLKEASDGDVIIPTDDDDWFAPQLRKFLLSSTEDMVHWNAICHKTIRHPRGDGRHNLHIWHDYHEMLCSNTYSFRAELLKGMKRKDAYLALNSHTRALDLARNNGGTIKKDLGKIYSCYNWHPGSASVLSAKLKRSDDVHELFVRKYRELKYHVAPWAKEYILRFVGVLKEIKITNPHIKMY
jgi:hypothetical protein